MCEWILTHYFPSQLVFNAIVPIHLDLLGRPRISECFQECLTYGSPKGVPPFFLTLKYSDHSPSDHPPISDGRLFGLHSELAPNVKIFRLASHGSPGDHPIESWRSQVGENKPRDRRLFTEACPSVDQWKSQRGPTGLCWVEYL